MNVPFLHRTGTGVYLSDGSVHWIELRRFRHHLRLMRRETEPVRQGNVGEALKRLVDRIQPVTPYVSTHLEPDCVRHLIVEGVLPDDPEGRDRWMAAQVAKCLPRPANLHDFMVCHTVLTSSEEQSRCLVACARREAVEERVRLLEEAGLKPFTVGTLAADLGHAYAFDAAFVEGRSALLSLDETGVLLLLFEAGGLLAVERLDNASSPEATIEQALACLLTLEASSFAGAPFSPVLLVGGDMLPVPFSVADGVGTAREVLPGKPLYPILRSIAAIRPEEAPAAAMAVQALYPTLPSVNFLDPEATERARQECDKKTALRAMLMLGGTVLTLLALLLAIEAYLRREVEKADSFLLQSAPHITIVERSRASLEVLKTGRTETHRLLQARTKAARLLEMLTAAVPEGVWLDRLELASEEGQTHLSVGGFSLDGSNTATFLGRLEREQDLRDVRLLYEETPSAGGMPSPKGVTPIRRFEIKMKVVVIPPSAGRHYPHE